MEYVFDILRRESENSDPYRQRIRFETDDKNETVATALLKINASGKYRDETGALVSEIRFEGGCLQKKCGACAMVINGKPALACDSFLIDMKKGRPVTLEPLSKFPVKADLITDRQIMYENLKTLKLWSGENGEIKQKNLDMAYDSALCLQCGLCLEVCPEFFAGGDFCGAAGFAPMSRLLTTLTPDEKEEMRKLYKLHEYEGCGKSLACEKICPAEIGLERLASRSNAIAVWRRK